MNKYLIQSAKAGAAALRWDGKYSEADAIDSLADEVKHYESKRQARSTLKKGDKAVMHTCMEADNPKYLGRIWTCKTDAYRNKGHDYDVIFLEGFSGSFATEFLQKVNITDLETENERLRTGIEQLHGMVGTQKMDDARLWSVYTQLRSLVEG